MNMRVLVVESDRRAADGAIEELRAAGHHVMRCHESDLPAFPCNALCGGDECPLENDAGVDVVVDYRTRAYPLPTPYEDGVSCALRHHVPLVVAGTTALNPFDKWTTAIAKTDKEVVAACERAIDVPIEHLAAPARAEVRRRLRLQPGVAEATDVVVRRSRGGQLDAIVRLADEADEVDDELAVAVAGVLRANDRFASRVNVAVERRPRRELIGSGPSSPSR
jgi:hypothetical protein